MYSNLRGQSRGAASSRSGHFLYHCVLEIFAIVPIHLFQILCRPFRAVGVPPTAFRLLHATSFLTQGACRIKFWPVQCFEYIGTYNNIVRVWLLCDGVQTLM